METFEYLILVEHYNEAHISGKNDTKRVIKGSLIVVLNELGKEGWEVVSDSAPVKQIILKRRLQ